MEDLKRTSDQSQNKFAVVDDTLAREEENDERYRSRQPTWTGTPLNMLNRDIKMHLTRLKEAFVSAKDRDKQLQGTAACLFSDEEDIDESLGPEALNFNVLLWPRKKIESTFLERLPLTGDVDLLNLEDHNEGQSSSLSSSSSIAESAKTLEKKMLELATLLEDRSKSVECMERLNEKKNVDKVIASLLQLHASKKGALDVDAEEMAASSIIQLKEKSSKPRPLSSCFLRKL